jgi:hypothetical protein
MLVGTLEMACMKPEQMELKNNLELHTAFVSSMVPKRPMSLADGAHL